MSELVETGQREESPSGATVRRANDEYMTPPALAKAIVRKVGSLLGDLDVIIEPSAGDGSFVKVARDRWPNAFLVANEIQAQFESRLEQAGADSVAIGKWEDWDQGTEAEHKVLILGNPPYSLGPEHVKLCLERMERWGGPDKWLCFLMRNSFLATQDRYKLFYHPQAFGGVRYVYNIVERPSFTNGGSDNAEYTAIIWNSGYRGPYSGDWLSWR